MDRGLPYGHFYFGNAAKSKVIGIHPGSDSQVIPYQELSRAVLVWHAGCKIQAKIGTKALAEFRGPGWEAGKGGAAVSGITSSLNHGNLPTADGLSLGRLSLSRIP
jgi:hypothetical protein